MVFRIHFFPSFKIRISFICKSFLKCLNFLYFGCTVSSLWHTGLSVAVCRLFLEVRWLLLSQSTDSRVYSGVVVPRLSCLMQMGT